MGLPGCRLGLVSLSGLSGRRCPRPEGFEITSVLVIGKFLMEGIVAWGRCVPIERGLCSASELSC